jgi:hypothetical protein
MPGLDSVSLSWCPSSMAADLTPSFITYKNYLRSFACLAGFKPWDIRDEHALVALNARVHALPTFGRASATSCDLPAVRRSLVNAWGTELLLALGGVYATDDELARLANNWAAVQLYYILYHATQALAQAKGQQRPTSHPVTQRIYADLWVTRTIDLAPWTLGVGDGGCRNLPSHQAIDPAATPVSWPRNEDDCWSYAVKALRTTRDQAVAEALRNRRRQQQSAKRKVWIQAEDARLAQGKRPRRQPDFALPHLGATEKASAKAGVRCHTFMDFCWRLRIKTNYEDSRMFLEGPLDNHSSGNVHHDLCRLASASLLVCELHLRQLLGVPTMTSLVDDWLQGNQAAGVLGVRQRRDLILK